jgi:hypothetical protein
MFQTISNWNHHRQIFTYPEFVVRSSQTILLKLPYSWDAKLNENTDKRFPDYIRRQSKKQRSEKGTFISSIANGLILFQAEGFLKLPFFVAF